jgi:hypothetical protein
VRGRIVLGDYRLVEGPRMGSGEARLDFKGNKVKIQIQWLFSQQFNTK